MRTNNFYFFKNNKVFKRDLGSFFMGREIKDLYRDFHRGNIVYDGEGVFSWRSQGLGQPELPLGMGLSSQLFDYISKEGDDLERERLGMGRDLVDDNSARDDVQFPTI